MQRPLSGLILTEAASPECPLAVRLALAMAGRVAADLGAEVTIHEPAGGDPLHALGPFVDGQSAVFAFLAAGKRLIRIPATNPAADLQGSRAILVDSDLAKTLGQTPNGQVRGIVALHDGSRSGTAEDSEFTLLALGGLLDLVGDPARQPLKIAGSQLAYATGLSLFTGVMAGLASTMDGTSETVRTNLLDMAVWLNWKSAAAESWGVPVPSRLGDAGEWQVIRCKDGYLALVYRDPDWATLKALVGDPVLDEPRFQMRVERKRLAGEVATIVEKALMRFTRAEVREIALKKRLPIGPVWSISELAGDPHVLARGMLAPLAAGENLYSAPKLPILWNGEGLVPSAQRPTTVLPAAART